MISPSALETLKEKEGKKISRILFIEYNSQEGVTREYRPEAYARWLKSRKKNKTPHYVLPIVNHYFKRWNEEGFIEKSRPLREVTPSLSEEQKRTLRYKKKNYTLSILSLEPIFRYCKDKKGILFTNEEKRLPFFIFDLKHDEIRKAILEEFPDDDIIHATLKFYVKNCILKYFFYLRDVRENRQKYKKYEERAIELNNPKNEIRKMMKKTSDKLLKDLNKKLNIPHDRKKIEFDIIKLIAMDKFHKSNNLLDHLFNSYVSQLEQDHDLVVSVDKKILSSLDINPFPPN